MDWLNRKLPQPGSNLTSRGRRHDRGGYGLPQSRATKQSIHDSGSIPSAARLHRSPSLPTIWLCAMRARQVQSERGYGSATAVRKRPSGSVPLSSTCGLSVLAHSPLFTPQHLLSIQAGLLLVRIPVAFCHGVPNMQKSVRAKWHLCTVRSATIGRAFQIHDDQGFSMAAPMLWATAVRITCAANLIMPLPSLILAWSAACLTSGRPMTCSVLRSMHGPPGMFLARDQLLHKTPIQTYWTCPARIQPMMACCNSDCVMSWAELKRMSMRMQVYPSFEAARLKRPVPDQSSRINWNFKGRGTAASKAEPARAGRVATIVDKAVRTLSDVVSNG